MARFYLINRVYGTNEWFVSSSDDGTENVQFETVDAILCASIMVSTRHKRIDGLVIDEVVCANVETGETMGKFERTKQLDLLQEPTRG